MKKFLLFVTVFFICFSFSVQQSMADNLTPIATVFGLHSLGPITDYSDPSQIFEIISATGFLLNSPEGEFWVSASHIIYGVDLTGRDIFQWQFFFLFPHSALTDVKTNRDLLKKVENIGVPIGLQSFEEDNLLGGLPMGFGTDFIKIKREKGLKNGTAVDALVGMELRDLISSPLKSGEYLSLEGIMGERLVKVECSFIGYDAVELFISGSLTIVMDCHDVPILIDSEQVHLQLGGVSGGPIRDREGKVAGIFTGSLGYSLADNTLWFLVGTPLFTDFERKLRPYPYPSPEGENYVDLICFEFFAQNGPSIGQILDSPQDFQSTCRVLNGRNGLEFQLRD